MTSLVRLGGVGERRTGYRPGVVQLPSIVGGYYPLRLDAIDFDPLCENAEERVPLVLLASYRQIERAMNLSMNILVGIASERMVEVRLSMLS